MINDDRLGEIALGVARAGQKPTKPATLDHQVLAAFITDLLGDFIGHFDVYTRQSLLGCGQPGQRGQQ